MTVVPIIQKPIQSTDLKTKTMDWFLDDRDLLHERVNPVNVSLNIVWTSGALTS